MKYLASCYDCDKSLETSNKDELIEFKEKHSGHERFHWGMKEDV